MEEGRTQKFRQRRMRKGSFSTYISSRCLQPHSLDGVRRLIRSTREEIRFRWLIDCYAFDWNKNQGNRRRLLAWSGNSTFEKKWTSLRLKRRYWIDKASRSFELIAHNKVLRRTYLISSHAKTWLVDPPQMKTDTITITDVAESMSWRAVDSVFLMASPNAMAPLKPLNQKANDISLSHTAERLSLISHSTKSFHSM